MSDYFIGEIRMFSFNYAPQGWAFCNGQSMSLQQNQALYALLGPTWGPATQTSFSLPDLRGRLPVQSGAGYTLGQTGAGGSEGVAVAVNQFPLHIHGVAVATVGTSATNAAPAAGHLFGVVTANKGGTSTPFNIYGPAGGQTTALEGGSIASTGVAPPNNQHNNLQPYQAINFCISLTGIFPQRN